MRRPRFIAEQARNARGPLGRLIASIMARETWGQNRRAIDALGIEPRDRVLDLGCGHGRSLAALAALAPQGSVAGTDPSELMAAIARRNSQGLIRSNRVDVRIAAADSLPFPDASFDKAMCVHVAYFWEDLGPPFREVARVLKPGGRFVLVARTDADAAAVRAFPADVYRFRPLCELVSALDAAGFAVDPPREDDAGKGPEPALLVAVKQADGSGARR